MSYPTKRSILAAKYSPTKGRSFPFAHFGQKGRLESQTNIKLGEDGFKYLLAYENYEMPLNLSYVPSDENLRLVSSSLVAGGSRLGTVRKSIQFTEHLGFLFVYTEYSAPKDNTDILTIEGTVRFYSKHAFEKVFFSPSGSFCLFMKNFVEDLEANQVSKIVISTLQLPLCQGCKSNFVENSTILDYKYSFVDFSCYISIDEKCFVIVTGYQRSPPTQDSKDNNSEKVNERGHANKCYNRYVDKCHIDLIERDSHITSNACSCSKLCISHEDQSILCEPYTIHHRRISDGSLSPQKNQIALVTQQYEVFLYSLINKKCGQFFLIESDYPHFLTHKLPRLTCKYVKVYEQEIILVTTSYASVCLFVENKKGTDALSLTLLKSINMKEFNLREPEIIQFNLSSVWHSVGFFFCCERSRKYIFKLDFLAMEVLDSFILENMDGERHCMRNSFYFNSFDGTESLFVNKSDNKLTYCKGFPMEIKLLNLSVCATFGAYTRSELKYMNLPRPVQKMLGI